MIDQKQDRQCTYTLRRINETIVALDKQYDLHVCVCVCVVARALACACASVALLILHAACIRHIVICGLWFPHIFRHDLINGASFGETLLNTKCVF